MKCRKCGHENKGADWVCSRCDYVLDTSFLGADILNERTSDGIVDDSTPPPLEEFNFGGDSIILGRLGDGEAAIESIVTDRTGGFLKVQSDANAPAAVYITAEISRLIVPGRVLRHTSDGNARREMLSPFEIAVFDLIDGVRTLADVQDEAGLSHNDLCIAVAMLHDKAVVEAAPVERAKKSAPVPVPVPLPQPLPPPLPSPAPALSRTSTPPPMVAPPTTRAPARSPTPPPLPGAGRAPALSSPEKTGFTDEVVPLPPGVLGIPGASRPAMVAPALRARAPASSSATLGPSPGSSVRAEPQPHDDAKLRAANHYDMCMKDLAAGRVSRAWGYAKLAAEAEPNNPKYVELLADWHKRQGAHGEMASTPQELMAAAQEAENRGDVEKAVTLLKRICEVAPKSAAAHNKLAVLLATKLRQFKPAYDAAIKAVELEPGNMSYQSNMMKILAKVDDVDRPIQKSESGGLLGRFLKR